MCVCRFVCWASHTRRLFTPVSYSHLAGWFSSKKLFICRCRCRCFLLFLFIHFSFYFDFSFVFVSVSVSLGVYFYSDFVCVCAVSGKVVAIWPNTLSDYLRMCSMNVCVCVCVMGVIVSCVSRFFKAPIFFSAFREIESVIIWPFFCFVVVFAVCCGHFSSLLLLVVIFSAPRTTSPHTL